MPLRVLYLSMGAELGGAEKSLVGLVTSLDRRRFLPLVVLPRAGPLADELSRAGADAEVVPFPGPLLAFGRSSAPIRNALGAPAALASTFILLIRLVRLTRRARIGLIHSNGIKAHILGCFLTAGTRIPLVWHVRDILPPGPLRWLLRRLGRHVPSAIIANSAAVAESFSGARADGSRVRIVHNGIDLESYAPGPGSALPSRGIGLDPERLTVGMVGVLVPWKGFDVFVDAAARLAHRAPRAVFFIVGDEIYDTRGHRGYRRHLEEKVRGLGLEGRVFFTGFRRDVPAIMNSLDIVVHASVRPEPFGRVILEAMACGRPVIATDAGGAPEVLGRDGSAGVLVPPGDARAMAEAVLELLRAPARRARMGQAGRERAVGGFSSDAHARGVQQVYEEVLGLSADGGNAGRRGSSGREVVASE